MILDPTVRVECDEPGCQEFDSIELTALSGGHYDTRYVKQQLGRMGWAIDGDIITCEMHNEEEPDDVKTSA